MLSNSKLNFIFELINLDLKVPLNLEPSFSSFKFMSAVIPTLSNLKFILSLILIFLIILLKVKILLKFISFNIFILMSSILKTELEEKNGWYVIVLSLLNDKSLLLK